MNSDIVEQHRPDNSIVARALSLFMQRGTRLAAPLIFALTYLMVLYLLSNYQIVWAQPGTMVRRASLLGQHHQAITDLLSQALNWRVMEAGAPRLTRPLANLTELFDTYFRTFMFSHFMPHPSISLTWIFSLFLSPILLLRSLRLLPIKSYYPWLGASIYMSTSGILSLETMSFREGKALSCFFFIAILYLSLCIGRTDQRIIPEQPRAAWRLPSLLVLIYFVSLFTDEIALFGLTIPIGILLARLQNHLRLLAALGISTVLFFVAIKLVLPIGHAAAGFPIDGPYEPESHFYGIVTLRAPWQEYGELVATLVDNTFIALTELTTLGLFLDSSLGASQALATGTILIFVIAIIVRANTGQASEFSQRSGLSIWPFLLIFAAAQISHDILMHLTPHPIWGLYWYGVFVSLPWTLLYVVGLHVLLCRTKCEFAVSHLLTVVLVCGSFQFFIPLNYAFKHYHYYGPAPDHLSDIFNYKTNMFTLAQENESRFNLRAATERFTQIKKTGETSDIPKELEYLVAETNYCKTGWRYAIAGRTPMSEGKGNPNWWIGWPKTFDVKCVQN